MVITTLDTLYIGIDTPEPPAPGMASYVEIVGDEHIVKVSPPAPAAKESA